MRAKISTLIICLVAGLTFGAYAQPNTGTGVTWGEDFSPSEPLQLNEDFSGFDFFHTDSNPNDGNSDNSFDNDGVTIIYGYKQDTVDVDMDNGSGQIHYEFYQCAFAPEWQTAYAYQDGGGQTANVSNGFVEISREYESTPPTVKGYFLVDLRELDFVDVIEWSHSSTGGNKRGVMCEFSLDDGTTWDTLRYQPGGAKAGYSFTKSVEDDAFKTSNTYRCDPSAYGMTWADGIWNSNVMLRFGECDGQTARIHDLKVYGTYEGNAIGDIDDADGLKIYATDKKIYFSEEAAVQVYSIAGALVKQSISTNLVSMDDMPRGIYLVKAQNGNKVKAVKVAIY